MNYRVYLLEANGHIRAGESFSTEFDSEAIWIASVVYDACSDVFPACEVWRGSTMMAKLAPASPLPTQAPLLSPEVCQKTVIELAERLQRSFACVRESRRLMHVLNDLKGRH